MAITFYPPSFRAAAGDLTIAVSPLGLVELADEEFEVHGPRLSRYATHWAWYLGHHWAHRREPGEPQLTFNYTRAFADYITNFTFAKPITFRSPKATSAIVPSILHRVWEQDNVKERLQWEIGQIGGVAGDVFVKVAYEEPYVDPAGRLIPGKVRIIPINPAMAFPVFHPHDRSRLIEFKLKYRFWGTSTDGARMVMTYVERCSDAWIEEYINDELIDKRPNPIGKIPYAWCPNISVSGSPWGLSDIGDITPLNREYNEKATEISDIINYYGAPVTVITGAKASNLERGPKKVWAIANKDAAINNLELSTSLDGPLAYLNLVRQAMHELTGVPETALGKEQQISNTSGVALQVQYQPLMARYSQKTMQYTRLFQQINELVLLTLAVKEPMALQFNPGESGTAPQPGQEIVLDPSNPEIYETSVHWPPPLPIDILIKLNEIQGKMVLGLESKRGALRDLGEEFPDEKMNEIFDELAEDAFEQGALDLAKAKVAALIYSVTGMLPGAAAGVEPGPSVTSAGGSDVSSAGAGAGSAGAAPLPGPTIGGAEMNQMEDALTQKAFGGRLAQWRNPSNTD